MVGDDRFIFDAFVHDLSGQPAMRRQLLQPQKRETFGRLAAGIAREINTPTPYVGDNLDPPTTQRGASFTRRLPLTATIRSAA